MWAFLGEILKQGGTVAALFSVVVAAAMLTIRALWTQHERTVDRLAAQNELLAERCDQLRQQLHELQERRVNETRDVTTRVVQHVAQVDRSMERVSTVLDVLIELSGKGGRR